MLKSLNIVALGTILFSFAALKIMHRYKLAKWQVSLGLIGLALLLYLLSVGLIKHYISKRTPDLASANELIPGIQKWEMTAGLGIVPKWVSLIGFLSFSAFITAVLPWLIGFLKR